MFPDACAECLIRLYACFNRAPKTVLDFFKPKLGNKAATPKRENGVLSHQDTKQKIVKHEHKPEANGNPDPVLIIDDSDDDIPKAKRMKPSPEQGASTGGPVETEGDAVRRSAMILTEYDYLTSSAGFLLAQKILVALTFFSDKLGVETEEVFGRLVFGSF